MKTRYKYLIVGVLVALIVLYFVKFKDINLFALKGISDLKTKYAIRGLHPDIRMKARDFINRVEKELGITLTMTSGTRTFGEQRDLYAQGRTKGGNIVTNAKPGESYHNYGLAFDIVEISPQYGFGSGYPSSRWESIGKIGEKVGFEWAGRWSRPDKPHFQFTFGKTWGELATLMDEGKIDNKGFIKA